MKPCLDEKPMRWMITDSGIGGLSVCAGLERGLRETGAGHGIELLYINATPEAQGGYNSLPSQSERIRVFNNFLRDTYQSFLPDQIAIACNTLSVIYEDTAFSSQCPVKVRGVVDAGVQMSKTYLRSQSEKHIIVFATETTTEADTYPRKLRGAENVTVVAQACPGLASAISGDASGAACKLLLKNYIAEALDQFETQTTSAAALLACTHYGYQAHVFKELLADKGVNTEILNPNDLLIEQLLAENTSMRQTSNASLSVRFVSRFPISQDVIHAMGQYLAGTAPLTLNALQNQEVIPDLFEYR
ncbi:MAG: aspartate/glutamate racemase family protein [Candidatus Marinimicrobia bacterium]|nr:aspartate/glutamate racemase family protein [Candidatus Neomarinimicrobiota bacterium]